MPDGGGAYATRNGVYIVPAGRSYDSSSDVRHVITPVHEMFHTVQYFEEAGLAGINIEDQVSPKRCGHMRGKEEISAAEMCKKIEAATRA